MTKAEEKSLEFLPPHPNEGIERQRKRFRHMYEAGYEQAEKDTIAIIREQVERWMPDNLEGDEYINGERMAFRSVLHLLEKMKGVKVE